jgi:putative CocE/NonD family hydrolase
MNRIALLLVLLAFLATPVFAADADYDRIDAMVPMSDGVSLDASLYVPSHPAAARVPLIVRHHGGGSNKDSPFDVQYALKTVATNRFAVLMYSVRGHGNSGGLFDFFGTRTTKDFSEMLDWVAAQHGDAIDTDRVGASGYSQGGGESLLPAEQDARVRVLAVGNTFADLNYALNPSDAFKFAFATGIFVGAYTTTASKVDDTLALRWGATFYTDTEDVETPLLPSTTSDLATRSPVTYIDALIERRVPVFWTNGFEDQLFPADHPERMLATLAAHGVPVHYWFASGGHAAGPNFIPEETAREQAMLDWFEQYLLGIDHGFSNAHQVDYWQRVTADPRKDGVWEPHKADAWPIPGTHTVTLYPHADGTLSGAPAGGGETMPLVNDEISVNVANDALTYEVASAIPGMGAIIESVPEGASPLDTVAFESAPLAQPLEAVGAPLVTIVQDSTRSLVQQFDAKLWDLSDAGAQLIWRGAISGPLAKEVSFKLWPNAHRFDAGHRVLLTISSVDFPTFKPDVELWSTNLLLDQTRVELPATAGAAPASSDGGSGGGGALPASLLLILPGLGALRRRRRDFVGECGS